MKYTTAEDFRYAVACHRHFHRYPEMLFDLEHTYRNVSESKNRFFKTAGKFFAVE